MGNITGCIGNLAVIITTLIIGFLTYASVSSPANEISSEVTYPFVLAEGLVNYSFRETINCQFVIAGNVEFLHEDAEDYENIAIMLQPLGTYDDRPPTTIINWKRYAFWRKRMVSITCWELLVFGLATGFNIECAFIFRNFSR